MDTRSSLHREYSMIPPEQEIRYWMSTPAVTVNLAEPVSTALALMHEYRVRRLPVVIDTGELRGIITLGDIRGADVLNAAGLDPLDIAEALRHIKVYEVMSCNPRTITPETGLREAAMLMLVHKIGGLPVVDGFEKRVLGMITESDLFEALVYHLDQLSGAV